MEPVTLIIIETLVLKRTINLLEEILGLLTTVRYYFQMSDMYNMISFHFETEFCHFISRFLPLHFVLITTFTSDFTNVPIFVGFANSCLIENG